MSNKTGNGGGKKPPKWGKGKTDPETWWKKGCPSPNPKGRPKGSKNQKTMYQEAFNAKVTFDENGIRKTMTKRELGYHQVAHKSATGDLKAFAIQKELDEKFDPVEAAPPAPEESAADFHTFQAWIALREKFKVFREADELPAQPDADEGEDEEDDEGGNQNEEDDDV